MEATASSKAKISRSASMGEGINTGEEQKSPSNLFRPLSTTDLPSENSKLKASEENLNKSPSSSALCGQVASGPQEAKTKSTTSFNSISDKLLMPPPAGHGVIPRLKKKAKSINNLSKTSRKEELFSTVVKSKASDAQKCGIASDLQDRKNLLSLTCRSQDVYNGPRRASIAECTVHTALSVSPTRNGSERAFSPSRRLSTSPTPCSNDVEKPSKLNAFNLSSCRWVQRKNTEK